ncbi:MAG: AMP-binding protein, partial [Acidimicrobiales bacterium]|nr:AMP-binding protein [Acidimicrobiales bacterium]
MATASDAPDRVLFHLEHGSSLTYGDTDQRSGQFANALIGLGLKKGDRLVVQVDKSPDVIA